MITVTLPRLGFREVWRQEARRLLQADIRPDEIDWQVEGDAPALFGFSDAGAGLEVRRDAPRVPKSFLDLAEAGICHASAERFSLPYRVLYRLQEQRGLLEDRSDGDVAKLFALEKSVRRDSHKMKAFVRFRDIGTGDDGRRQFAAWFEPDHFILERTAPFFARRFADMDWAIAVPGAIATYRGGTLSIDKSESRPDLPDDSADDLWRTYFASIFNPARLKVKAMKAEMPVKYWKNMPEAQLIPELIAGAEKAALAMQAAMPTLAHPRSRKILERFESGVDLGQKAAPVESLDALHEATRDCARCGLCQAATQVVNGQGPKTARLMIVGEQPGDQEDLSGQPFVGPAGKLLSELFDEAGIEREAVYLTNAVKHFKFTPRGKRRIHQKPNAGEVQACRFWLDLERKFLAPDAILALGATAALALTRNDRQILTRRGGWEQTFDGQTPVLITIHPAAVLRAGDGSREARAMLLSDLRQFATGL